MKDSYKEGLPWFSCGGWIVHLPIIYYKYTFSIVNSYWEGALMFVPARTVGKYCTPSPGKVLSSLVTLYTNLGSLCHTTQIIMLWEDRTWSIVQYIASDSWDRVLLQCATWRWWDWLSWCVWWGGKRVDLTFADDDAQFFLWCSALPGDSHSGL